MKTNQSTPTVNQPQGNTETMLKTLDDVNLEKLSGGAVDFFLKLEGIKGESANREVPTETISLNFGKMEY